MHLLTRSRLVAACVAATAMAGIGSIAWAAVGDGGVISGCLSSSGYIRGIDDATGSCKTGDTSLSWYTKEGAEATFLGRSERAADADTLDGLDSTAFLRTTGKAADADKLDGYNSTEFARTRDLYPGINTFGHFSSTSRSFPASASTSWTVRTDCWNYGGATRFEIGVSTNTGQFLFALTRPGGTSTAAFANGSVSDVAADRSGPFVIQMTGGGTIVTVTGSVAFGTGTCIASMQAVITG